MVEIGEGVEDGHHLWVVPVSSLLGVTETQKHATFRKRPYENSYIQTIYFIYILHMHNTYKIINIILVMYIWCATIYYRVFFLHFTIII